MWQPKKSAELSHQKTDKAQISHIAQFLPRTFFWGPTNIGGKRLDDAKTYLSLSRYQTMWCSFVSGKAKQSQSQIDIHTWNTSTIAPTSSPNFKNNLFVFVIV